MVLQISSSGAPALEKLLANNRAWAARVTAQDPQFFTRLAAQQVPEYLWIGCSDARVPANEIVDLRPGEIFVQRNIANLVLPSDLNCMAVIQFAVDVLKVRNIIVTGHYGCGGVRAALEDSRIGLADHWIAHVAAIKSRHDALLDRETDFQRRWDLLCELNVIEQVVSVCRLPTVRDAWARGQALAVHGWVYGLQDGLVRDLGLRVCRPVFPDALRQEAVAAWLAAREASEVN